MHHDIRRNDIALRRQRLLFRQVSRPWERSSYMKTVRLLSACALLLFAASAVSSGARVTSVAMVWRVPAPQSADPGVQAVEAGITALGELNAQLKAFAAHPGARATLAFDPSYVAALERLASGSSALKDLADAHLGAADPRAAELLDDLSQRVVVDSTRVETSAGKRFTSYATAARLALNGNGAARFSTRDLVDFTGTAIALTLASSGAAPSEQLLLKKDHLDARDLRAVSDDFSRAAQDVLTELKAAVQSGSIELAALPAYEPIVPLIVDAAARTRSEANTVDLSARSDAAAAIEDGARTASALGGGSDPGIVSPHGAYDDETASLMQERHPAYALFSDRVAKATTGASAEAVSASQAAALHGYLLETSRTSKLPILFCSDTLSATLDVLPATTSPSALGERVRGMASDALAASSANDPTVLVLCLDLESPLLHRADRGSLLGYLAAVLSSANGIEATTPKLFLRRHPPTVETYGFEPGSDAGGFALWMGSANQASLWTALLDARKSAGGDAALTHAAVRDSLLRAESNRWFMALQLPQPRQAVQRTLSQYRSAIAQVYRAANVPVPADIAPIKWDHSATIATPPGRRV